NAHHLASRCLHTLSRCRGAPFFPCRLRLISLGRHDRIPHGKGTSPLYLHLACPCTLFSSGPACPGLPPGPPPARIQSSSAWLRAGSPLMLFSSTVKSYPGNPGHFFR